MKNTIYITILSIIFSLNCYSYSTTATESFANESITAPWNGIQKDSITAPWNSPYSGKKETNDYMRKNGVDKTHYWK